MAPLRGIAAYRAPPLPPSRGRELGSMRAGFLLAGSPWWSMTTVRAFEELKVWQKARQLTLEVYTASNAPPFTRDFALRDQIRKASVSAMSNIAEGFERGGVAEFQRFLVIAKASVGEVRAQVYVASDLGYLSAPQTHSLLNRTREVSRLIGGLLRYLRSLQPGTRPKPETRNQELGTRNRN